MNIHELIALCEEKIPREATWKHARGEAYGAYHVERAIDVTRALYCVTPQTAVVEYALREGYELLIAHHPFVVYGMPSLVFHTALDMCPGGLNDLWREKLGLQNAITYEDNLGWFGEITPCTFDELLSQVKDFTGGVIGQQKRGNGLIKTVITCAGMGGYVQEIVNRMMPDCFITGQLLSYVEHMPLSSVIETGHTLSERCGQITFQRILEPHGVTVDLAPLELDRFGGEVARRP